MKLTLLAVVGAITMAKASILDNINIDYTENDIAASILDNIDINYTDDGFNLTPEEIAASETNIQTLTLDKRGSGKRQYKPHFCHQTAWRDCVVPLWEVDSCYNFEWLGMNDGVRSWQIPHPLTCAVYKDSNYRANRSAREVTEWNAGADKDIDYWWHGASSIRCRLG
jgi:hypothetical protein